MNPPIRTRFAPSPTGDLHLGGAYVALASWGVARRAGGEYLVRIEDIDTPRIVRDSESRILEDLEWLGLSGDSLTRQSERTHFYKSALDRLTALGLVYPCDCSRAEIARIASAPHESEESVYPGTCRNKPRARVMKRPPALRFAVPPGSTVTFVDGAQGSYIQRVDEAVGDFVLRRGDGVYAYQLAAAVDDAETGVSDVIRGMDLLSSTPRQMLLLQILGYPIPRYIHLPLVLGPDGERLAKRTPGASIRALRESGHRREEVVGAIAHALGWVNAGAPLSLDDVRASFAMGEFRWPEAPWCVPRNWGRSERA